MKTKNTPSGIWHETKDVEKKGKGNYYYLDFVLSIMCVQENMNLVWRVTEQEADQRANEANKKKTKNK